jgi:DNA polymerase-3 subunit chi
MTQVDFYILNKPGQNQRISFATRFIEKLYRDGHHIHVHCDSESTLKRLDDMLWTARDVSFVPHQIANTPLKDCPVTLGMKDFDGSDEILLNFASEIPLFFSHFSRVVEIINTQDADIQQGRMRYRFYRDRGYPLNNHPIQ